MSAGSAAMRYAALRSRMTQDNTLGLGEWAYAQTANCAIRRSAFQAVGGFRDSRQQFRIPEPAQLRIQEFEGLAGIANPAGDQQLRDDRRNPRLALKHRDAARIMRANPPAFGHERRVRSMSAVRSPLPVVRC